MYYASHGVTSDLRTAILRVRNSDLPVTVRPRVLTNLAGVPFRAVLRRMTEGTDDETVSVIPKDSYR
jgi:hypothetical protein